MLVAQAITSLLLAFTSTGVKGLPAVQQTAPIPVPPGADASPNCAAPTTRWEQHYCAAKAANVQEGCMPQRRFAYGNSSSTNINGVVLIYHGFTACPDAMEYLAVEFQNKGYHVYIPLNPGHGLPVGQCSGSGVVCVDNYRVDQLPTTKDGYVSFVSSTVDMLKEEMALYATSRAPGFTVATTGLSLGGPLATVATWYGAGLFTKTVLVNPYYSAAEPNFDHNVQICQAAADPPTCMNNFLNGMIGYDAAANAGQNPSNGDTPIGLGTIFSYFKSKAISGLDWLFTDVAGNVLTYHYPDFIRTVTLALTDLSEHGGASLSLTDKRFSWGAKCLTIPNRPGFCSFQIKHLMAINALGLYAVSRANHMKSANIAFINTVRDGYMREGVIYSTANKMQASGSSVSYCLYYGADGCADLVGSNVCGVPHAAFSHVENFFRDPFTLYWEPDMFSNIIGYINGTQNTVGIPDVKTPYKCTTIALNNQPAYAENIAPMAQIVVDAEIRWPN
ncbi:hypothetical protein HDU76_010232 [Blyttiomyces sp. JEL0837]|nr:hypothetical protein HDU76_010232 [Blyttiomyces sp. JEL0837]